MKKLSKNFMRTLMVIGALVMLMCAPVSAKTESSVKAVKVGKTFTIKNTSKVTSSKKKVATTKQKNKNAYKISALKAGKSTLKVYDKNGKLSQKVYLLVYSNKTLKYDTTAITLTKGGTKKVQATVPSGCTVKYASSNKNVAKVNANGKITAVAKGTATIKAQVYYKNTKIKTFKKNVTVKESTSSSSTSSSGSSSSSKTAGGSGSTSGSSSASFENHVEKAPSNLIVAGGNTVGLGVWCEKSSDTVTYKLSNDNLELNYTNAPKYLYDSYLKTYAYYSYFDFYGRKQGTCNVSIYINGKLFGTYSVTITSTDDIYYAYLEWKQNMKDEIWTDDMTDREKIDAVGSYIRKNCTYISDQSDYMGWAAYGGGNCIAAADLVIDIAHDLGLEAEEYLVNGTYAGHVYAIVYYEPGVGTKVDISFT